MNIMTFKDFIIESFNKSDYEKMVNWLKTLNLKIRTPRGMKKEHELLRHLERVVKVTNEFRNDKPTSSDLEVVDRIMNDDFNKSTIDKINDKFGIKEDKPLVVQGKFATYIKSDPSAYTKFLAGIKQLETFLSTLKGLHKKSIMSTKAIKLTIDGKLEHITANLVIEFVDKKTISSKAKYETSSDKILINLQSMGNTTDGYGSLVYVVLHELGHRYLKYHKQSFNYDGVEWITTKYSRVDTFTGEEKFAELFAISHWKNKYSEYKETIDKFEKIVK